MKLIQITDIHIGEQGEDTRGVDVRRNFLQALDMVKEEAPDALVLTGDLCYRKADPDIYAWIRKQLLDKLPEMATHTFVMNGNHDRAAALARSFDCTSLLHGDELYYKNVLSGQRVLYLDSGTGEMSDAQYAWLDEQLATEKERLILFIHHPPLPGGVPFMDINHSFKQMDRLTEKLTSVDYPVLCFCGHYHVAKAIVRENLKVFITPSTFFQIRHDREEFAVDHYMIGFRIIEFNEDRLDTRLVWMPGNHQD